MREQFSSTDLLDSTARPCGERTVSVGVESHISATGITPARFTRKTARIGAFVLSVTAFGALCCGHVRAEQNLQVFASSAIRADPGADPISRLCAPPSLDQPTGAEAAAHELATLLDKTAPASAISPSEQAASIDFGARMRPPRPPVATIVVEQRDSPIPFRRVYRMSRSARPGSIGVVRQGQAGVSERTYKVTYRADAPVAYSYVRRRVAKAPVDMLIDAGYTDRSARALPSRSGLYTRAREIDMVATGYSPMEGSGTGRCANGMRAGYGVVAVDPRLVPLGSKLFIEGYGYALAGDTGGAIRGRRIDLGQNTYHAASLVGRRKVRVYVLNDTLSR